MSRGRKEVVSIEENLSQKSTVVLNFLLDIPMDREGYMIRFNWKPNYSKTGVIVGLILALPPLLAVGVGSLMALRVTEGEIRGDIQQSIGDTTLMMATHFRAEFKHLLTDVEKEGEIQRQALKSEEAAAAKHPLILGSIKPPFETIVIDMIPEILDLSVWYKDSLVGEEDNTLPQRRVLGMNSKFPAFTMDRASMVVGVEEIEKQLVNPAFQGRKIVALAPAVLGVRKFATVAIPLGKGKITEIAVAHVNLSGIQSNMPRNGMVPAVLVDDSGRAMIRSLRDNESPNVMPGVSQLLEKMNSSKSLSGQLNFTEETATGRAGYFGGYSRIGIGHIAVLASLAEAEGTAALHVLRTQLLGLWFLSFLIFFTIGNRLSKYIKFKHKNESPETNELDDSPRFAPQKVVVTVLYGSLRSFSNLFASETAEDIAESINDYLGLVSSSAKEFEGRFERFAGGESFVITWGAPESEGTEAWRAMRCALQLRTGFKNLNELRKVDGQKALTFCIGIHTGNALAARIGIVKQMSYTVIGDVLNCAKSLSQISAGAGRDILVSQDVWSQSDSKFVGEVAGEAKLTHETGLTYYYTLSAYRNEQGQEVEVPAPVVEAGAENNSPEVINKEKKSERWLINNGSQIVGPFGPEEIASRLFAQELDFDCECWSEGIGTSSQIKSAGIFSGSQDEDATLWLYDGKIVHGPMSPGFLRTAIGHGAMPRTVFICEKSTVNGWLSLESWDKTLFGEQPSG
ncbi:MAG: adenylate/guanylate cyclase domain-containing protein [Bdellovibrionia bacterium]